MRAGFGERALRRPDARPRHSARLARTRMTAATLSPHVAQRTGFLKQLVDEQLRQDAPCVVAPHRSDLAVRRRVSLGRGSRVPVVHEPLFVRLLAFLHGAVKNLTDLLRKELELQIPRGRLVDQPEAGQVVDAPVGIGGVPKNLVPENAGKLRERRLLRGWWLRSWTRSC